MRAVFVLVMAFLALVGYSHQQAHAIPLAALVAGQSITCGDKEFNEFAYVASGDADVPAGGVQVTCVEHDPGIPGGVGIEFAAPWHDDGGGAASDYLIEYTVTSAAGPITLAHISGNPDAVGEGAATIVTENFDELPGSDHLTIFHTVTDSQSSDTIPIPDLNVLHITKDILLDGGSIGGIAAISHIDQIFQQPEPATWLLLAAGLGGLLRHCRKRRGGAAA